MTVIDYKNAVIDSTEWCGAHFSPCRRYRYALWRRWQEKGDWVRDATGAAKAVEVLLINGASFEAREPAGLFQ